MQQNKNKIHQLSKEQAQKIAAGEVIERPANIVKELLENSIDAGASKITITIEKAGKKLIQISDDGCGMNPDDAATCFLRHATSKITSVDDLETVSTFGFRGEALASIAAVGLVTLTTQEHSASQGSRIVYTHGVHTSSESGAFQPGTTISIADLFETIPVRKTFLKQDETEWNQIMGVVNAAALTHPHLTIKVIRDGAVTLHAPHVESHRDRITQLWKHTLTQQLSPVSYDSGKGIVVTGFTSHPTYQRYGKDLMYCFINGRHIKNIDLVKAVVRGYKQSLLPGKYPATFLWLELDTRQVDVNIHPRKEEVRFTKPGVVASAIERGIYDALQTILQPKPAPATTPLTFTHTPSFAAQPEAHAASDASPLAAFLTQPVPQQAQQAPTILKPQPLPEKQEALVAPHTTECHAPFTVLGQLFLTYILLEQEGRLVLVDQHAAHERILYNQLTARFEDKEGTALLFPEVIHLQSQAHCNALLAHESLLCRQGLALHHSGPQSVAVTSAPPKLQKESLAEVLSDLADYVVTHEKMEAEALRKALNEHVNSHLACKTAVRAGDALDHDAMKTLVQQLFTTENRFMCIHGRPTHWVVEKTEIEKRFRR
jgi:DNA mismatch repair protein MutL